MFKKSTFFLSAIVVFAGFPAFAQQTKPTTKTSLARSAAQSENEKQAFEAAAAQTDLTAKINALQQFAMRFPRSANRVRALEIIVSTRAQLADAELRAGNTDAAVALFEKAVADAPAPVSDKLYADVIVQLPANLFYGGRPAEALKIARLIEEKVKANPKQLLGLATFYLGTENAARAKTLADAAIALDANLPAAYQTLGLANRLNFQLEDAAAAYAKALELDSASAVSKRSLAEMKRALSESQEAVRLYRELVAKDANDAAASNGLILALFDAGNRTEAEPLLASSLVANPNNLPLLVGAAYWYAAHNDGAKAVDFARKALAIEPRYTWAHIALARGLAAQNRPLEAEKPLLLARQYGNFPTLDYELASVRYAAGLYQEAANELKKSFVVNKDGAIETKLAGRVPKQSANFIELLELERRASIFQPRAADTADNAAQIKSLLNLNQTVASAETTPQQLDQAVDEFTKGADKMRTHRQLYAANRLLQEKKNLTKAVELAQSAVRGVDESLTVETAATAVLADELIESRTRAISRGEVIIVPEVPRQTLSAVLRGRIEDTAGWTLYQQGKTAEAVTRLKRAVSILPEKSSFRRASLWRLGAALDADGNPKEALDAYVKSYADGQPDPVRRSVIEAAYFKINGNLDGLDALIGARPAGETVAQVVTAAPQTAPEPTPEVKTEVAPNPQPAPETTLTPSPAPSAAPVAAPAAVTETSPTPAPSPTVETKPENPPPSEIAVAQTTPNKTNEPLPPTANLRVVTTTTIRETPISANSPAARLQPPTEKPAANEVSKNPFESVVIKVPSAENPKSAAPEEKPANAPPAQTEKIAEKPAPAPENAVSDSPMRIVVEDKLAGTTTVETPSCLVASQENISILNQGGSLGILIGYALDEDVSKITAESVSPADVTVTRDPEVGKQSNRAFFIVKSVSPKIGVFSIVFSSPCGKKEIVVKVR